MSTTPTKDEERRPVPGYPAYVASSNGDVWSVARRRGARVGRKMKPTHNRGGYMCVDLRNNGVRKHVLISRLVAITFELPNPENKPIVDHKNNIATDNRLQNLRWATPQENSYNRKMPSNNTSGYKGVSFKKNAGKYEASIRADKKLRYLGQFETAEEANAVVSAERTKLHGDYCNDN